MRNFHAFSISKSGQVPECMVCAVLALRLILSWMRSA